MIKYTNQSCQQIKIKEKLLQDLKNNSFSYDHLLFKTIEKIYFVKKKEKKMNILLK